MDSPPAKKATIELVTQPHDLGRLPALKDAVPRLVALDQFRGYTLLGMFLVNFLGSFAVSPRILKHTNDYCSYADSIMPQFFFAVGFGMFWTSSMQSSPRAFVRWKYARRILGLIAIGYFLTMPWGKLWGEWNAAGFWWGWFKRDLFQTLVHIAATSVWVLPCVKRSDGWKWGWMFLSALLHLGVSTAGYFDWVHQKPSSIDGGPLGFLTWSIPTIAGMLVASRLRRDWSWRWLVCVSIAWMLVGYGLSCGTRWYDVLDHEKIVTVEGSVPPKLSPTPVWPGWSRVRMGLAEFPGFPPPASNERQWNYWMMSQRGGTVSYLFFASGLSAAVFGIILFFTERGNRQGLAVFTWLGSNSLLLYCVHGYVLDAVRWSLRLERDSPPWHVLTGLALSVLALCWLARFLYARKLFFKI